MAQEQDRAAAVPQSANVAAINVAGRVLYRDEEVAFGNSGYRGVDRRPEAQFIAMMPSKRRMLNPFLYPDMVTECAEKMKAGIQAKVEQPFRVLRRQFEYTKARYRGLAKNTARIVTLFAVSNPVDSSSKISERPQRPKLSRRSSDRARPRGEPQY